MSVPAFYSVVASFIYLSNKTRMGPSNLLSLVSSLLLVCTPIALAAKHQVYPLSELEINTYESYKHKEEVKLQCIKRQIDNGEHVFDDNGDIVFEPFMSCLETNSPFSMHYMQDSNVKCTVKFEDEIYHLFQLYLHKDAPFTCRYEIRPNSGIYIPLDLNFRGNILESHFDIDPNVNLLMISNKDNEIVAGTGFSSSTNTTKVIIGQKVELNFNVRWTQLDKSQIGSEENGLVNVYWIPSNNPYIGWIYAASGCIFGIVVSLVLSYRRVSKKIQLDTWNKVE